MPCGQCNVILALPTAWTQVFVSSPGSPINHTFDLRLALPRNASFLPQPLEALPRATGSVAFSVDAGPRRVQQWLQTTYAAADCGLDAAGSLRAGLLCLRDETPLVVIAGARRAAFVTRGGVATCCSYGATALQGAQSCVSLVAPAAAHHYRPSPADNAP